MSDLVRSLAWPGKASVEEILDREWIVTNGVGGYASGTVSGVITRRFHGLLIAALPSPFGRRMMLNEVVETVVFPDGRRIRLGGEQRANSQMQLPSAEFFKEFRVECGLPVWIYEADGMTLEKRLVLPHRQNTVYVRYRVKCPD